MLTRVSSESFSTLTPSHNKSWSPNIDCFIPHGVVAGKSPHSPVGPPVGLDPRSTLKIPSASGVAIRNSCHKNGSMAAAAVEVSLL